MSAWSRSPSARSGGGIAAILARTSPASSVAPPDRAAFSSLTRSCIAARSSSVNLTAAFVGGFFLLMKGPYHRERPYNRRHSLKRFHVQTRLPAVVSGRRVPDAVVRTTRADEGAKRQGRRRRREEQR